MTRWDGRERRSESFMFTRDEKETILSSLKKIELILTGNGHPEEGLVYKNEKNTEFRMFWQRFGWLVLTAVMGVPTGVTTLLIIAFVKNQ